jgi:murein DD-endopeptidase MepM/ murein hydrolase activator NlpD
VSGRRRLAPAGCLLALALIACASPSVTPAYAFAPSGGSSSQATTAEADLGATLAGSVASFGPRGPSGPVDKTRRFWTHDKHRYDSRWYAGAHRKMVPFGCTAAPYYPHDPTCPGRQGIHHGLDIAMPCGTTLYAGLRGTVVRPDAPGALGPAYGPYAFRLRNHRLHKDFVLGHVLQVYVEPGDHVRRGTRIARASDQGAPDGCHLHFEVRPAGGSYQSAVAPTKYLHLHRHR